MKLRKCPSCREIVGTESAVCPRCGVNFKAALFRRIVMWTLGAAVFLWLVAHFVLKKI